MSYLDAILAAEDLRPIPVECPEWGLTVHVVPFDGVTHEEYDKLSWEWVDGKPKHVSVPDAWIVGKSLCDEQGQRLNPTAEQIKALNRKCAGPLLRIARIVAEASGMRASDRETARKNFEETQTESSG